MSVEKGFRVSWDDVTIESRNHLPAYMTLDDYHLNGHGQIAPRKPLFYGHLTARCRARDQEAAASRMLDAFEIFMAVFNLYEGFGRRSIGSDIRKDGKLWNGPYQFLFNGRRFIGRETVWYEPEFREDDWTSFPPTMREVLRVIPRVRKALRALEASPLRLTLTGVLRLLQDAMVARDPRYKLLRYWSALEQLYSEPQSREKKYGLIINRATSMDHNKPLARWKLSHISRLRNAYVHAGGGDNELQVMSEHLRLMLSRHVNFLLFHAPTVSDHNHWLALSDLPDKEDALLLRRALLDQRIGLVQARDAAWAKAVAKPRNK